MRSAFSGFPQEGIDFMRGLARHNRREWFQPRKHLFDERVKAPMQAMVEALNGALTEFAPEYVTEPKQAIYRIYRDTRFSADKATISACRPRKSRWEAGCTCPSRTRCARFGATWPRPTRSCAASCAPAR